MNDSLKPIIDDFKEITQTLLSVQGKIPEWLKGSFVRNGPVSISINTEKTPHWFDGLAMLHSFTFQNGQIIYSNQFLKSDPYNEVFEKGNLYFDGFSTQNRKSLWQKLISWVKHPQRSYIQNANVNVARIAKQYVALTETPLPVRFELNTLNTLGALEYQDDLPKKNAFDSAHPHIDPHSKEQINYLVEYGIKSYYVVYRLNPTKPEREVIAKVPIKNPAYMHSFALTKHFIILVEYPFTVNPLDLLFKQNGFINNFSWHPELGTNFIVIDRISGKFTRLPYSIAFFAFHHVNAFEMDDNIILDMVTYPDAQIIANLAAHGELKPDIVQEKKLNQYTKNTKLMRYTLSLQNQSIQSKILVEQQIEFPRINEHYSTKEHRYIYLVNPCTVFVAQDVRPLYKIDTKTDQITQWSESGVMPGEPVFIAHPTGIDEDDGIIVTIVLDNINQKSFLLMLDAKTFKEIARSYTPCPIPVGLHGQFFEYTNKGE